jgi:lipoprotein-releasing system ATP-binding protein
MSEITKLAAPAQSASQSSRASAKSTVPIPHSSFTPTQFPVANRTAIAVHLAARDLHKHYRKSALDIPVLTGVDMQLHQGEFLAIVGQSGCGKSTLLHLLGLLDAPTSGEVHFLGRRIDNLPAYERERLRNEKFGMIFQFYHLLPELTTLENVLAPLMIGRSVTSYWRIRRQSVQRATQLLETLGLGHRLKHRPRELSGGEMQRVAIARALIASPEVLLADEPTGNLDQSTGQEILQILRTLNQQQGLSIVMVTHDLTIAAQADRLIKLAGGQLAAA